MRCPRTGSELKSIDIGGVSVDVSRECGGVFFDSCELQHFDEKHEIRGEVLAEHLSQFHSPLLDETERIECPKCPDVVMMRRYFSPKRMPEIDECPQCGGIWLDVEELKTLRDIYLPERESKVLTAKLIMEVERHPDVVAYQEDHNRLVQRMESLTELLWRIISFVERPRQQPF